ncbi:MAG TPA: BtpA/SgcQ family protein, partial [Thermomicrobiales bacterium]|nr:BtpA/SgcQ family protein [Thermomicrobiales bacterium]
MRPDAPGAAKTAIGMVQLHPLPGTWRYDGEPLAAIVDAALTETRVLAEAGFDGVQLQNMGDNPSTRRLGPETVA